MLSIPFLRSTIRSKAGRTEPKVVPDVSETLTLARKALRAGNASRAHSLVVPTLSEKDAPAEARLVAGKALSAMGRYPEALMHFEAYLASEPGSVEGLLAAGLTAARAQEMARAADWFNRACLALTGRARKLIEPLMKTARHDPVAIEEMVAELESYPEDRERALALACALGRAGHFRAVERYLPGI